MAVENKGPEPRVEPSSGPSGGSVPAGGDASKRGKPASQGDNPKDRYDSEGVTPANLESSDVEVPPAAGSDPDSVARFAKSQLGALHSEGDDLAADQLERVAKARALIAERNGAGPDRVKAIDAEIEALGFPAPVATTEAQRRGDGPVGRHSGQHQQG